MTAAFPLVFYQFGCIAPAQSGQHPAHALLQDLLQRGQAWIKRSGSFVVSERHSTEQTAPDALAASYLRSVPERVVWGSDCPYATASSGAHPMPDDARQVGRLVDWAGHTGDAATPHRVLVGNPAALYGFKPTSSFA
ncbi:amidohydrolase family protein [Acidovorax sp. NCPPB 3576]|nr:amidohydrolase family protein [Acidovorax sp. NCPPB 3576]WCM90287.1 amidohydrolase family protein [Acidovorax sp. NCPPB 3576]